MAKHLQKAAALEQRLARLADDHDAGEDQEEFLALSSDVKKKLKSSKAVEAEAAGAQGSGVIYLGHIPHGFHEEQMRAFFGQFGDVKRVRLSRSTKTAKSRGYAFVEFEEPEVAHIVAETMNGYYLSGRKLVCEVVPLDKLHPDTFNGANHKFFKVPWRKLEKERRARPRTEKVAAKCLSGLLRTEKTRRQRIADAGIDYEFPGFEAQADVAYVRRKRRLEGAKGDEEDGEAKSMVEKGGGGAAEAEEGGARPSKKSRKADVKPVESAKGKAKDGAPRSATVKGNDKGKEGNKGPAATAVEAPVPVPSKAEAGSGKGHKGNSKAEVSKAATQRVSKHKASGPASSKAAVNASNVDVLQKLSSQGKAESSVKRKRPSGSDGGDKPQQPQQQQQQTKNKAAQQPQLKKQKAPSAKPSPPPAPPQVKKLKPVAEKAKPIAVTEKKVGKPKATKKQKK